MKALFLLSLFFIYPLFGICQKKLPIGGVVAAFQTINLNENEYNITFQYDDINGEYDINCISKDDVLYFSYNNECYSYKVNIVNYYYESIININIVSFAKKKAFPIGIGILARSDGMETLCSSNLPNIVNEELNCYLQDCFNILMYH